MEWTNAKRLYLRYRKEHDPDFFMKKGLSVPKKGEIPNWTEQQEKRFEASFNFTCSTVAQIKILSENSIEFLMLYWLNFEAPTEKAYRSYDPLQEVAIRLALRQNFNDVMEEVYSKQELDEMENDFRQFLKDNQNIIDNRQWFCMPSSTKNYLIDLKDYDPKEQQSLIRLVIYVIAYSQYETAGRLRVMLKCSKAMFDTYRQYFKSCIETKSSIKNPFNANQLNRALWVVELFAFSCFSASKKNVAIENLTDPCVQNCIIAQSMRWAYFKEHCLKNDKIRTVKQYYHFLKNGGEPFASVQETHINATDMSEYGKLLGMSLSDIMAMYPKRSPEQLFKRIGRYIQAVERKGESKVRLEDYIKENRKE